MTEQPTREKLEEQLKYAFQEFLMSGEFLGLQVAHKVSEPLWKAFYRYLEWRWDRLYGKKKKGHTKSMLREMQKHAFGKIKK